MEKRNSSIPKMVQYQKATSGFSHENTLRSDAKLLIRKHTLGGLRESPKG
jgi:hypothetical protein